MTRKTARGRRKRNRGWFKRGTDARRHVFTTQDCRIGWWIANIRHPELREWLRMRLFVYYGSRRKEQANGQAQTAGSGYPDGAVAGSNGQQPDGGSFHQGERTAGDDDIPF